MITLDIPKRSIELEVTEDEIQRRLSEWTAPAPKYTAGALAKYARLVSSASKGAVCS
jgi:dihydroxy-acid dehydratase